MKNQYDFRGWCTRNNIQCADGRTIMENAFAHNDGKTVPMVWNHRHGDPSEVLGQVTLENRKEGVYGYGLFNDTESGKTAKMLVQHGDIDALSILANQLQQNGGNVIHGDIKEVSLVLAGANPGAYIESVLQHNGDGSDEVKIFTDENIELCHSESSTKTNNEGDLIMSDILTHADPTEDNRTVKDVFDTLSEDQKTLVYGMIQNVIDEYEGDDEGDDMKHNVFDLEDPTNNDNVLSHSELEAIFNDGKRYGSLKDSVLAHGITNVDYMFPDAKNLDTPPSLITRDMGWVSKVMNGTHHTPFSRIKSMAANLTPDEARAKGYIKGNQKTDEVFGLLKRSTTPTTVYKKQKLDRDDVIDITDFDVVAWLKMEMRMMLDEELARAFLIGDGRSSSSDDKINSTNIRPIWTDDALYSVNKVVTVTSSDTEDSKAKKFIRTAIRSRKDYKGSGNPTLFTTEDTLTSCLLIEDTNGRVIYESVEKLATALRVKEIVTVPVMESQTRTVSSKTRTLLGIIVNLFDYNVGADKGGAVNMFDDFDIDYNQQKYLIETRCSGALIKPYSAIVLEEETANP